MMSKRASVTPTSTPPTPASPLRDANWKKPHPMSLITDHCQRASNEQDYTLRRWRERVIEGGR
jgi:hypothetical protein